MVQAYPSPEEGGWPPQAAGWGTMANLIARRLRKSMTPQEVKLWVHLRSWRQRGFHFRRQSPRDGYIVDFVCMKHRLVIEVDGGQHNFDQRHARDVRRDGELTSESFRVLDSGTAILIAICLACCNQSTTP